MTMPHSKQMGKIRSKLEKSQGSLVLPLTASPLERLRHEICRQFVIYQREHNLKSKDLAKIVGVDVSVMSKVLRYRSERFTTDRLILMLAKIYPKHQLVLKVS